MDPHDDDAFARVLRLSEYGESIEWLEAAAQRAVHGPGALERFDPDDFGVDDLDRVPCIDEISCIPMNFEMHRGDLFRETPPLDAEEFWDTAVMLGAPSRALQDPDMNYSGWFVW